MWDIMWNEKSLTSTECQTIEGHSIRQNFDKSTTLAYVFLFIYFFFDIDINIKTR